MGRINGFDMIYLTCTNNGRDFVVGGSSKWEESTALI